MTLTTLASNDSGITKYLKQVYSYPLLTDEEETDLTTRWCNDGDLEAAHKLVRSHLRLVVKIAFSFRRYGAVLADMISEGNIGLMKAVKKFRLDAGCKLATYAAWWIKSTIQEYILRSWSLLKINTTSLKQRLFSGLKQNKEKIELIDSNCHNSRYLISLDNNNSLDNDNTILETLTDRSEVRQDEVMIDNEEKYRRQLMLKYALLQLNERERDVFCARKLSNNVILEQLAQKYNVSRERIRQIEERSMEKITTFIGKVQNMSVKDLEDFITS